MNRSKVCSEDSADQSELIGLSEINFLLVVALIAMVASPNNQSANTEIEKSASSRELVDVQTAQTTNDNQTKTASERFKVPEPTHTLQGASVEPGGSVVIAVPQGFPLENVQFLIEKQ